MNITRRSLLESLIAYFKEPAPKPPIGYIVQRTTQWKDSGNPFTDYWFFPIETYSEEQITKQFVNKIVDDRYTTTTTYYPVYK